MPSGKFEFKLAVRGGDGSNSTDLRWQPGENRCLEVPADPAVLRVEVSWDGEPAVEVVQPERQGAAEPAARAASDEQVWHIAPVRPALNPKPWLQVVPSQSGPCSCLMLERTRCVGGGQ